MHSRSLLERHLITIRCRHDRDQVLIRCRPERDAAPMGGIPYPVDGSIGSVPPIRWTVGRHWSVTKVGGKTLTVAASYRRLRSAFTRRMPYNVVTFPVTPSPSAFT